MKVEPIQTTQEIVKEVHDLGHDRRVTIKQVAEARFVPIDEKKYCEDIEIAQHRRKNCINLKEDCVNDGKIFGILLYIGQR